MATSIDDSPKTECNICEHLENYWDTKWEALAANGIDETKFKCFNLNTSNLILYKNVSMKFKINLHCLK